MGKKSSVPFYIFFLKQKQLKQNNLGDNFSSKKKEKNELFVI